MMSQRKEKRSWIQTVLTFRARERSDSQPPDDNIYNHLQVQAFEEEQFKSRKRSKKEQLETENSRSELVGLALSGGGIRSATFNLGVLQGLARRNLIAKINYISTVSGGGYIGAWLISWIKRANNDTAGVESSLAGQAARGDASNSLPEPNEVNFLRDYSNYLTPRKGIYGADTWAAIAGVLRNILLNQLVLITFLGAILVLPWLLPSLLGSKNIALELCLGVLAALSVVWRRKFDWHSLSICGLAVACIFLTGIYKLQDYISGGVAAILLIISVAWISLQSSTLSYKDAPKKTDWSELSEQQLVIVRAVCPFFVAAFLTVNAVASLSRIETYKFVLGGALVYLAAHLFAVLFRRCASGHQELNLRQGIGIPSTALVAGAVGGYVISLLRNILDHWHSQTGGQSGAWHLIAWGPPAVMTVFLLVGALHIGLLKLLMRNEEQEWWGRLGGLLMICSLAWAGICGIAIFVPWMLTVWSSWIKTQIIALVAWAGTSGIGLFFGKSEKTSGKADGNFLPELLARTAPYIFVVGFMIILSLGIHRLVAGVPNWRMPGRAASTELQSEKCPEQKPEPEPNKVSFRGGVEIRCNTHEPVSMHGCLSKNARSVPAQTTNGSGLPREELQQENKIHCCDYAIKVTTGDTDEKTSKTASATHNPQSAEQKNSQIISVDWTLASDNDASKDIRASSHVQVTPPPAGENEKQIESDLKKQRSVIYWANADKAKQHWKRIASICVCLLFIALVLGCRIEINTFSLNPLYRNRLVRCYLGATRQHDERKPNKFTGFDPDDDLYLNEFSQCDTYSGPYPIICATLNVTHGERLAWQERKAESFIFSPGYCGYEYPEMLGTNSDLPRSAYRKTADYAYPKSKSNPGLDSNSRGILLGTAMSISGAAVSPNMGYHTSPPLAFLMTLFNLRLGWWLPNPRFRNSQFLRGEPQGGPRCALPYLLCELFASTTDRKRYVNISDGGHFENLAIYELVRRRCKYIIACDASEDKGMHFGDLGNAIRKCRTDFGVEIEINPSPVKLPDPAKLPGADSFAEAHCVVGKIFYPESARDNPGLILYIKPTITKDVPRDILAYREENSAFPHQPTADQWFDESQFESYRRLGLYSVDFKREESGERPNDLSGEMVKKFIEEISKLP